MMHPNPLTAPAVTISTPDDLLSAVPAVLGFHPTDSVVLVCLQGHRRFRLGPVLRINAPTTPDETTAAITVLTRAIEQHADDTVLIIYSDTPHTIDTRAIAEGIARVRTPLDLLIVGNNPHPVTDEMLTATVATGRTVLADRSELARSVEYHPGTVVPTAIIEQLASSATRDALIAQFITNPDNVAALVAAAQATPDTDPRVGNLCAALAVLAYRHGDGALAAVAIDRAERTTPGHTLAELMTQIIITQLPPPLLDTLLDDLA